MDGRIESVFGSVVDVRFPAGATPQVSDALVIEPPHEGTLEVVAQRGDGVVPGPGQRFGGAAGDARRRDRRPHHGAGR